MNRKQALFKLFKVIGDIMVMNLAFLTAFYLRFYTLPTTNISAYWIQLPYLSIFTIIILHLYNLYSNQLKKNLVDIFYSFIPATILIVLFSVFLSYFKQTFNFPRSVFLIALPVLFIYFVIWRYFTLILEKKMSPPQDIVIIGKQGEIAKIIDNIQRATNGGYHLKGVIVQEQDSQIGNNLSPETTVIKGFNKLENKLKEINPELVFISGKIDEERKKELFYHSLEEEWEVSLVPDFYEIMLSGAEMKQIGEFPVFEMKRLRGFRYRTVKRFIDIVLSLFGLVISLPVTLVVAILIKLESRGPVFFKQKRISKGGQAFHVYKFRTMVNNAEKKTGPVLSGENDRRVTRIGNILRKTRIDEIPQLYNVLKGDMSLIGPRPERPHFVEKFEEDIPDYKYRHRIKSGITGLAQIFGYYSSDPEDKLRLDLLYANKASPLFDLKIILHTIKVMLMGHKSS